MLGVAFPGHTFVFSFLDSELSLLSGFSVSSELSGNGGGGLEMGGGVHLREIHSGGGADLRGGSS